ncbi:MAG: hypothetical protein JNK73_05835 [Bacteroidia bacterium]|nr:hypothetical protein [Bacteroidia bacterium]
MDSLPKYIPLVFAFTALLSVWFVYNAANKSKTTLILLFLWLGFQAGVSLSGFYTVTDTLPPRFILMVAPPLLFILFLFITKKGRTFLDTLDTKTLTLLHVVRVPVEFVLLWLFLYKAIPQVMTFEGRNFDILAGFSAPLVYYFGCVKAKLNRSQLIAWNLFCLGLLFNIVAHAALSVPSPLQQMSFDQPNIAILHFPFNWLPSTVVPLVLFSHLVCLRQLFLKKTNSAH